MKTFGYREGDYVGSEYLTFDDELLSRLPSMGSDTLNAEVFDPRTGKTWTTTKHVQAAYERVEQCSSETGWVPIQCWSLMAYVYDEHWQVTYSVIQGNPEAESDFPGEFKSDYDRVLVVRRVWATELPDLVLYRQKK